jgi:hypothetical protein
MRLTQTPETETGQLPHGASHVRWSGGLGGLKQSLTRLQNVYLTGLATIPEKQLFEPNGELCCLRISDSQEFGQGVIGDALDFLRVKMNRVRANHTFKKLADLVIVGPIAECEVDYT